MDKMLGVTRKNSAHYINVFGIVQCERELNMVHTEWLLDRKNNNKNGENNKTLESKWAKKREKKEEKQKQPNVTSSYNSKFICNHLMAE